MKKGFGMGIPEDHNKQCNIWKQRKGDFPLGKIATLRIGGFGVQKGGGKYRLS
jgi:hypothetical protein